MGRFDDKGKRLVWQKWFWPDYENHPPLRACSWAAQGLWPRMLAVMWRERGRFLIRGKQPEIEELAALWGKPAETIPPLIAELEAKGVFSRDEVGVIYCRRMVRDMAARADKTEPSKTERELSDEAIRRHLEEERRAEERRAQARARTRRWRERRRRTGAGDSSAPVQTGAGDSSAPVQTGAGDGSSPVTPTVTVTSPPSPVTSHRPNHLSGLGPSGAEARDSEAREIDKSAAPDGRGQGEADAAQEGVGPPGKGGFAALRAIQAQWAR